MHIKYLIRCILIIKILELKFFKEGILEFSFYWFTDVLQKS